ncbi:MAG TPA: hypothetical protein DCL86_11355, partial [Bacteroidales bacterium]|nr:hypothetical protein [Bacteroidales bacterium]
MDKSKARFLPFLIIVSLSCFPKTVVNQEVADVANDSMQLMYKNSIDDAANDKLKRIEAHFEFGEYLDNQGQP